MRLAAHLDRLRADHAGSAERGANERANRSLSASAATGRGEAAEAALAVALGATNLDGLLCRDEVQALPVSDCDLSALPEVRGMRDADWVYLDTETTGLSGGVGNLAFMIGAARIGIHGQLQVRQFILGRFAAEPAMLSAMADWIGPNARLISYNGKCFDVPLLQSRLRLHRIDCRLAAFPHLDLLYTVRRAFRRHWPDCRLQTAERRLLGIDRQDDLPGAEAPAAWRAWMTRRSQVPLDGVLRHNFQDVASLALLHRRLVAVYTGAVPVTMDHATVGRAWIEAGDELLARRVWQQAAAQLDEPAALRLAASYRRAGDWATAESLWLGLAGRGSHSAACELSKYYEHRRRDLSRALRFAHCCEPTERAARLARLGSKLGKDAQLALWQVASVGEGDEIGRTV